MKPIYVSTPLWESRPLSAVMESTVLLKMEALQPSGSFKARGMSTACVASQEAGATRLVSSSGGNAGYAVAYAGRQLGMPTTIVVPKTTARRSRELIESEGAELIEHGDSWDEAHLFAIELAKAKNGAYIHPFDDPTVWAGNSTIIDEMAEAGPKPSAIVTSVGGGGLMCGLLEGLHRAGWADVPVLAVETEGAASFAASVRAGKLVTLDRITSIATTLGARKVAAEALEWTKRHEIIPWVVTDREAVDACLRFADDHRILVEPACGASLSAIYGRAEPLVGMESIVVIVCGGAGVDMALLEKWDVEVGR
jgi:L-serine/L-threonine ammonia-lyase